MSDRKSSWEWLQNTLAERLGVDEAARIWAEYHHRADLEEIEVKRRRYQRKLGEALARFKETGHRHELRTIERYQRWLAQLPLKVEVLPALAVKELGGPST